MKRMSLSKTRLEIFGTFDIRLRLNLKIAHRMNVHVQEMVILRRNQVCLIPNPDYIHQVCVFIIYYVTCIRLRNQLLRKTTVTWLL